VSLTMSDVIASDEFSHLVTDCDDMATSHGSSQAKGPYFYLSFALVACIGVKLLTILVSSVLWCTQQYCPLVTPGTFLSTSITTFTPHRAIAINEHASSSIVHNRQARFVERSGRPAGHTVPRPQLNGALTNPSGDVESDKAFSNTTSPPTVGPILFGATGLMFATLLMGIMAKFDFIPGKYRLAHVPTQAGTNPGCGIQLLVNGMVASECPIQCTWPLMMHFTPFGPKDADEIQFVVLALEKIVDSHIHVWSDGQAPYQWFVDPPPELQSNSTFEAMVKTLESAGVNGALIVQPINHKYDHAFVLEAIAKYPEFLRGMCLVNPTLPESEAVKELERLGLSGFVGVRFNPGLFPDHEDGMASPVGKALFKKAGELMMTVGFMCYNGLLPQMNAIEELMASCPSTLVVIDHWGFFRQPASGGLLGDEGKNNEESWEALLSLAKYGQVYVKVSALFRMSAEPFPHKDLQPRLQALIKAFGSHRLMWGSDWPFQTIGGNNPTSVGIEYDRAVHVFEDMGLPEEDLKNIMEVTATRVFRFDECIDVCEMSF